MHQNIKQKDGEICVNKVSTYNKNNYIRNEYIKRKYIYIKVKFKYIRVKNELAIFTTEIKYQICSLDYLFSTYVLFS